MNDAARGFDEELGRSANRVCVPAPDNPAHCLKYPLPNAKADANALEWRAWQWLQARLDANELQRHFAHCHGLERTSRGVALRCDVVRDANGDVARSLHAHLFDAHFATPYSAGALCDAVAEFERFLIARSLPLFDLNAGNFAVVREPGATPRLVCVDAKSLLASKEFLPLSRLIPGLRARKLRRRAARLRDRIRFALAPPSAAP